MLWWQCSQIRNNSSSPEQSVVMWVFCFTENVKQLFLDAQTFPNPTHTSVVHRFIFSKPSSPIMVSEGMLREGMGVPSILGSGCRFMKKIFFLWKRDLVHVSLLIIYYMFSVLKKNLIHLTRDIHPYPPGYAFPNQQMHLSPNVHESTIDFCFESLFFWEPAKSMLCFCSKQFTSSSNMLFLSSLTHHPYFRSRHVFQFSQGPHLERPELDIFSFSLYKEE